MKIKLDKNKLIEEFFKPTHTTRNSNDDMYDRIYNKSTPHNSNDESSKMYNRIFGKVKDNNKDESEYSPQFANVKSGDHLDNIS